MAKRFTDTDKWKKQFIRGLDTPYKLLYLYILDDCDHAGIWHVDFEVAQIRTGVTFDLEIALDRFKNKVTPFDDDEKWFIPDFIEFQYGELNAANRVHNSIIQLLTKYKIQYNKPLISPLQGVKDKDKDKVKDKDKDKEQDKDPEIIFPYNTKKFLEMWELWKKYRAERKLQAYKPIGEQAALKKLSKYDEDTACEMIMSSIENNYQGIFELKTNINGKHRKLDAKKLFGDLQPGKDK